MTSILFIRHGETEFNREGRYQGTTADSPLTAEGVRQARTAGELLRRFAPESIVASPLGRALRSAKIIAEPLALPVAVNDGLAERDVGELSGLTGEEAMARFPELYSDGGEYGAFKNESLPGGEDLSAFYRRVWQTVEEIACEKSGETVLIVSHGGCLNMFMRAVLNIPLEAEKNFFIKNSAINRFIYQNGRFSLDLYGYV